MQTDTLRRHDPCDESLAAQTSFACASELDPENRAHTKFDPFDQSSKQPLRARRTQTQARNRAFRLQRLRQGVRAAKVRRTSSSQVFVRARGGSRRMVEFAGPEAALSYSKSVKLYVDSTVGARSTQAKKDSVTAVGLDLPNAPAMTTASLHRALCSGLPSGRRCWTNGSRSRQVLRIGTTRVRADAGPRLRVFHWTAAFALSRRLACNEV